MQDHPFFAAYAPQDRPHQRQEQGQTPGTEPTSAAAAAAEANTTEQPQQEKQPNVEDPPEIDPATLNEGNQAHEAREGPWARGRRRRGSSSDDEPERRRGCPGRRGGWGGRGRHGGPHGFGGGPGGPFGPGFPFGGNPFWTRGGPGGPGGPGPHHHHPPPPPGCGPGFRGRGGPFHRGGPPHHPHPHGPPPHHHHGPGPRGPSPPPQPHQWGGVDLTNILDKIGAAIGVDLTSAARDAGFEGFMSGFKPGSNPEIDFEPKSDIFDLPDSYIVHVSLPGAKKPDIGVDWDGEHSSLRVAGVVYRPDVDEKMMEALAVDGRKRETGVFEKMIRLGTRRDPATVVMEGIRARMVDGVLIITVPKGEKAGRRDITIQKSETPSPVRDVRDQEKRVTFDNNNNTDREMTDVSASVPASVPAATATKKPDHEITLIDLTREAAAPEKSEKAKGKEAEVERERERSATVEPEEAEQLPAYHAVEQHDGSDWEHFGSDEEGEYVNINVD